MRPKRKRLEVSNKNPLVRPCQIPLRMIENPINQLVQVYGVRDTPSNDVIRGHLQ